MSARKKQKCMEDPIDQTPPVRTWGLNDFHGNKNGDIDFLFLSPSKKSSSPSEKNVFADVDYKTPSKEKNSDSLKREY